MTDMTAQAVVYVRKVLAATGLSPSSLAKKARISPSTLTRALNDPKHKFTISLLTIRKLAEASGIAPDFAMPSPAEQIFGEYNGLSLAKIRRAKGLTQAEVGASVGAHFITISKLERGEIKMTLDWLHRLAPILDLQSVAPFASATVAVTDLLAFLHYVRAEHGVDVPERHFETLRTLAGAKASS